MVNSQQFGIGGHPGLGWNQRIGQSRSLHPVDNRAQPGGPLRMGAPGVVVEKALVSDPQN